MPGIVDLQLIGILAVEFILAVDYRVASVQVFRKLSQVIDLLHD